MSLDRFLSSNEANWRELTTLVDEAGAAPHRLGSERLRRMGTLYRHAAADLAQARRRFPGDPVIPRLETLVARARAAVYGTKRRTMPWRFFTTDYWRILVERPRMLALATAALFVPAVIGVILANTDPDLVGAVVPEGFQWLLDDRPEGTNLGLSQNQLAIFSSAVLVNNIRVTILAFALGLTFGVGTVAVTAYNGILIGLVAGAAVKVGNGALLVEAIVAHGILELSCIVVGALAGFRLASGLVDPGLRPRRIALVEEAIPAVKLILGTAPWLFLAGFVEGFVSRTGTTAGLAAVIGLVLGGVYWGLAVVRGTAASTADAPLGTSGNPA